MKKKILRDITIFLIGGLVFGSIGTVFALTYRASDIVYTPTDNTWNVTTVGEAISDLALSKTSDNYSTNEQVVGTWINGKPIYQRTVRFTSGGASWISVGTDIDHSNWETSFVESIFINTTSDGSYYGGNQTYGILINTPNKDANVFRIHCPSWTSGSIGYITVQYTKTTDQVNS